MSNIGGISNTNAHLNGQGALSANMQIAIEYLAMPNRGGLQLKQIAEKAQISEKQLRNWRKTPRFQKAVDAKMKENVRGDMPDVLDAVVQQAKNGSGKHAELLLKLYGMFEPEQHEITAKTEATPEYDPDELDQSINEFKQRIGKWEKSGVLKDVEAYEVDE